MGKPWRYDQIFSAVIHHAFTQALLPLILSSIKPLVESNRSFRGALMLVRVLPPFAMPVQAL